MLEGNALTSSAPDGRPSVHTYAESSALALLVESTTDYAIFMLDRHGYVTSWNAGARRIKGYSAEEIIGKHFSIFYPDEANARNWPAKELEYAEAQGRFEDEGWRLRKDGSRFWANVVITALRDPSGTLIGFGKVSRDLTERQMAVETLKESEERFRLLVESTIDYAIFMLDPTGHVASWNPGAQRIKGYSAAEIIGKHFSTFYTEEAKARRWPEHEIEEATRTGRFEDEGWRVKKDGSTFWANVVLSAIRGSKGELLGFAKVTRDISQRKIHEQRIEKLTQELEHRVAELAATNSELAQKSAENESFVYSVSHDLRSPLVNLQGFSQELVSAAAELKSLLATPDVPAQVRDRGISLLDGELAESVAFIRSAVQHLGNIIDGLLRLSRVGRVEYQVQRIDAKEMVDELLTAMHTSVSVAGARVDVGPLPVIHGDRNAVAQVFANLIGNALKSFSPDRPGVLEISASEDPIPVFAVRDNGIGIPEEYQRKIFRVFQHVHSGPTKGEGMGLAIVRRIVERHGGRIWFESFRGKGTTFYFHFGPASAVGGPAS